MNDEGKILAVIEPDNHRDGVVNRALWLAPPAIHLRCSCVIRHWLPATRILRF